MQYDNTNQGALFANKERRDDKDPNARGTINIEGVEYWLSAWTQTSKAGDRYQKLKATRKEAKPAKAEKPAPPAADDPDDSIPFAWAFAVPVAGLLALVGSSMGAPLF